MKRCTAGCARSLQAANLKAQSRRCVSYDKDALTKEALLKQVESGLGKDVHGNPVTIDPDTKTVKTAIGDLPISPVMDPAWMQARRRPAKQKAAKPTGRFRRKLANNPFALALITPLRRDMATDTYLPRYFFQDFELVQHPDPEETKAWWAPGPLSFDSVVPAHQPGKQSPNQEKKLENKGKGPKGDVAARAEALVAAEEEPHIGEEDNATIEQEYESATRAVSKRAPLTGYTLARKGVVDSILRDKILPRLLARRHGMAMTAAPQAKDMVWREDMADVVLNMMRRTAVDALIHRAIGSEGDFKFIEPCDTWEDAKKVELRGCILWIPKDGEGKAHQYATLDVEGVQFGDKLAVHDLNWLLGEEEVTRLREANVLFREKEIYVLKQWRSEAMIRLHQLLWRLQGYLYKA